MTARKTKAKSGAPHDMLKGAVLNAALAHAPFDGFTDKTLQRAAKEAGADAAALALLFPDGALSLVEAFSEWADGEMGKKLAKSKLSGMKIRERIKTAVAMRLAVLKPHKEAARRAAAFLTLPPHAAMGMKLLYRTVDAMWRAAGDTSTDFNFYTKRAILAGVFSSTLMRWFTDESEDEHLTSEFLDRRIEDVMRFEKFKAQLRESAKGLPSLSEIFEKVNARRS
jgi:ubiquinone biosynthesis protein COQ9